MAGRGVQVAISEDGGKTWKALGHNAPGGNGGTGKLAVAADGSAIVWTTQGGRGFGRGGGGGGGVFGPFVTYDHGGTWTNCSGLNNSARVVADPVNPDKFYSYDAQAGKLFVSTNRRQIFLPRRHRCPSRRKILGAAAVEAACWRQPPEWKATCGPACAAAAFTIPTDGGVSFYQTRHD